MAISWSRRTVVQKANRPFVLFSELPVDLRLLVWETTFEPRVVDVEDDNYRKHNRPKNPIALSVCAESRKFTETHYPLCFNGKYRINFKLDTILHTPTFPGQVAAFLVSFDSFEIANIRYLAIQQDPDIQFYPQIGHTWSYGSLIRRLSELKQLIIVYEIFYLTGDEHPFLDREADEYNLATMQLHAEFAPRRYRRHRPWPRFLSRLPEVSKTHQLWTTWTKAKVYPMYGYRESDQAWEALPKPRSSLSLVQD